MRLVGTTKPTIEAIRERTHWNSSNLQPMDPVTLGLCSQTELDAAVKKAARRLEREQKEREKEARKAGTLLPAEETIAASDTVEVMPPQTEVPVVEAEATVENVFGTTPEAADKPENDA